MIQNTIAIDGPAASGKSTAAEALAKRLDFLYFDTGVMYRAVTWAVLDQLGAVDDEDAVSQIARNIKIDVNPATVADGRPNDVLVNGRDITWEIRSAAVNAGVSPVSTYPQVRDAMTVQQRRIGVGGMVVMVGRDIGTVVMPDAEMKFFINASAEVRAQRRYKEVLERGLSERYEDILASILLRDQIDSSRTVAPLRPAADAIIIDSDHLTREEVVITLLDYWSKRDV